MAATGPATRPVRGAHASRASGWPAAAIASVALLIGAGGVVALVAAPIRTAAVVTTGQLGGFPELLVLATWSSLVAVAAVAWFGRRDGILAVVACGAGAAWMAAELAGSASVTREARSLGTLVAPLLLPTTLHLPIRTLQADASSRAMRVSLVALYGITMVVAAGYAGTYDPFYDVHCSTVCAQGDNLLAVRVDVPLARSFVGIGQLATLIGGLAMSAWAVLRLRGEGHAARRAEGTVLLPAIFLGGALAWWAVASLAAPRPALQGDPGLLAPALAVGICLTALAIGIAATIVRQHRRAEALRRLADAIDASTGTQTLGGVLAGALGDPRLRVAYPLGDGVFVDEQGEPTAEPRSVGGRAVTAVERGSHLIAIVEHDASLAPDLLDREIGAAARLAVDNERLRATIRARLRELRASRARIVEAGDAARGRLERDLHDGAQQRLLAVSFELRLAAAALSQAGAPEEVTGPLDSAIAETDRALDELRQLAHGIHPVVLTEDGLMGALTTMAESSPMPLTVTGEVGRCAAPVELAAYLVVEEALRRSQVAGATQLEIDLSEADERLRLTVIGRGLESPPAWTRLEDRVGAAGGSLTLAAHDAGRSSVEVVLPCG